VPNKFLPLLNKAIRKNISKFIPYISKNIKWKFFTIKDYVLKDSNRLGCYTFWNAKELPAFSWIIVPSFIGPVISRRVSPKKTAFRLFETLVNIFGLHSVSFQKTWIISNIVLRTSNLTLELFGDDFYYKRICCYNSLNYSKLSVRNKRLCTLLPTQ